MSFHHPNDPFEPPESPGSFFGTVSPAPPQEAIPADKRLRTSGGVRLIFGGALVTFVTLGGWLCALLIFPKPNVSPPSRLAMPLLPPAPKVPVPPETGGSPESTRDELFLALADSIFAAGDAQKAWEQVARTGRVEDARYANRILRFGLGAEKYEETLIILASSGNETIQWSESEWIMIAALYEKTGQLDKAIETVNRRANDKSEIFRLRAQQEMLKKNFAEAILNQEQYLARMDIPSADAWENLASLYASLDLHEEAARARKQSAAAGGKPQKVAPTTVP